MDGRGGQTMEYMLLIYNDENAWASPPDSESNSIIRAYFDLTAEMRDHGAYITGAPPGAPQRAKVFGFFDTAVSHV
jgi:hypothetical protein